MLTNAQEKLIRSLHNKKGREETGLCLVEGGKFIKDAVQAINFVFSREDTKNFDKLISTQSPQDMAAIAKIPRFTLDDINKSKIILVLDGVQDPGNVGTILRLCLGFNASLILIESADPSNPKVIRSSVGAFFNVPWVEIKRSTAEQTIKDLNRPIYKMEKRKNSLSVENIVKEPLIIIAGSEGSGISLALDGQSLEIKHKNTIESLNVASAVAIVLYCLNK